jgi:hypothetical protein
VVQTDDKQGQSFSISKGFAEKRWDKPPARQRMNTLDKAPRER